MIKPPIAKQIDSISSSKKNDPYNWLRADNWQEVMTKPEKLPTDIRDYIVAENKYTDSIMKKTSDLQKTLFAEFKSRIKEDDQSLPHPDGDYEYYTRFEIGAQYPVSCRNKKGDKTEQILFNFNDMATGFDYFSIGGICCNNQQNIFAYGLDLKGSEYYTIRFKNVDDNTELTDVLENTSGSLVWSKCDNYVFYGTLNENHRTDKIWRHKIGTKQSEDELIYNEKDERFFIGVSMSGSKEYIYISAYDHITSEMYFLKSDNPLGEFEIVQPRKSGVEYSLSHRGDYFYITTNVDGAIDYKVMKTSINKLGVENWIDFIPYKEGVLISGISVSKDYMLRIEKENALPRIVIHHFDSATDKVVEFDEQAYSLGLTGALEFEHNIMRFSYSSPTTQNETYDYDMDTGIRTLSKRQIIPCGHEPKNYECRRIYATADDGAKIPITLVYKKTTKLDENTPCVLYGYGSYGNSMPASFSTSRLSLLDRGFVWAVAHIRGGMDCGYNWYTQGKLMNKKNTFTDFIACGNELINQGFTGMGNITAMGGSAGGMLMGAVINMRPDMFKSVLALVPFVDVLNTICDDTLPLTPPEWNEWGNPLQSEEVYKYMQEYSPYDNVSSQSYPHIYVQAGLTDPRVTYWEPAKWVAKLRKNKTNDDTMLVLRTQMGAGHSGATGRWDALKELAEEYAFIVLSNQK
ncbi:MAG: S9 family peptidase [Alphaproteobacteria bacterium]|nr:S9 family peptidase [Alphaproteobacteria bacterium]